MANIVETRAPVMPDVPIMPPTDRAAAGEHIAEIIGRTTYKGAQASVMKSRTRVKTVDDTVPDYEFYDKLRRGKTRGYALGSLFAKRIENIYATWIMGDGVFVALKESGDDNEENPRTYTDGELTDFLSEELTTFITVERDKFGIGDQYIVMNVDGSLSVPSPDTVDVTRNPFDYREIEAVDITTKTDDITIVDRYTRIGRTVTVTDNQQRTTVMEFENLFDGEIPVVHVAFGMSANETNGHSVHEQLVPLYDQYDEVIFKQLDGVKLIGSPMLAIQGLEDLTGVVNLNEPNTTTTYGDKDGIDTERQQLNIDENAVLLIGKGGQALFVAPPTGFTADTQQALKTLFLLLLDHTGIPEFIWGNEISSGRSSSEVQLEQWGRDVTGMRRFDEKWLKRLCGLWLKARALIDPKIVVDELTASWPELRGDDAELLLNQLRFTADESMLTREAMLELLDLVDDAADAVAQAEDEADARAEKAFPEGDDVGFGQRLSADDDGGFDNE